MLDKIRKLLAHAESARATNESEAAAFADKAASLLAEHNLTLTDLRLHQSPHDLFSDYTEEVVGDKYQNPWRDRLIASVAQLYFCTGIRHPTHYTICGAQHNVAVASAMTDYLIQTTIRLGREYSSITRERHAFERGCGTGLANRLHRMYLDATRPSTTPNSNPNNLPALYETELDRANQFMSSLYRTRPRSARTQKWDAHASRGYAASNDISLNPQINPTHLLR